jgi:hypothetical protein
MGEVTKVFEKVGEVVNDTLSLVTLGLVGGSKTTEYQVSTPAPTVTETPLSTPTVSSETAPTEVKKESLVPSTAVDQATVQSEADQEEKKRILAGVVQTTRTSGRGLGTSATTTKKRLLGS